jgi:transposase
MRLDDSKYCRLLVVYTDGLLMSEWGSADPNSSLPVQPESTWGSIDTPSVNGCGPESSAASPFQAPILGCTTSEPSAEVKTSKKRKLESLTAGSVPANKRTTYSGRSNTSRTSTRTSRSSPTSGQVSTSSAPVSSGFWSDAVEARSAKCWFPSRTDCVDLGLSSSDGCCIKTVSNSWLKVKRITHPNKSWLRTSQPWSTYSLVGSMDRDDTKKTGSLIRCRRIRLLPTLQQQNTLKQHFLAYNKTWNTALLHTVTPLLMQANRSRRLGAMRRSRKYLISAFDLRKLHVNKDSQIDPSILKTTPKTVRYSACKDLASTLKGLVKRLQQRAIRKAHIQFKPSDVISRSGTAAFGLEKRDVRFRPVDGKSRQWTLQLFASKQFVVPGIAVKGRLHRCPVLDCDPRVYYEYGQWYLLCPFKSRSNTKAVSDRRRMDTVALDPNCRNFFAYYSPEGEAGYINERPSIRTTRWYKTIKNKTITRTKNPRKRRLVLLKQHHRLADLHWKTAHYLCSKFKRILRPTYRTRYMVTRQRRINQYVAARMKDWQHHRFWDKLRQVSLKYPATEVWVCSEWKTTKTCGSCGHQAPQTGNHYSCSKCGMEAHRDMNAARNIYLKNTQVS